jgi:RimJ/RimL family protein N-acetyltransferase
METLDWHGAKPPRREALDGASVRLEPLDAHRHGDDLFAAAAGADETWRYLPYGPFAAKGEFLRWLDERSAMADAIVDRSARAATGIATFMSMVPEHGVIEIGHIWLSPRLQKSRQATEAIFVMARHAFDDLGNRRLEWKCSNENAGSKRAALRFGFTFEGLFRQHRVDKGRNRDTAWFSIIDSEWPSRRAAFEAWLASENFDSAGRQRQSLAELREGIRAATD